jgi:hypothetical protein
MHGSQARRPLLKNNTNKQHWRLGLKIATYCPCLRWWNKISIEISVNKNLLMSDPAFLQWQWSIYWTVWPGGLCYMIWWSVLNDPYYRRSWASAIPILYCMTWWNVLYDLYDRRSWVSCWWASPTCLRPTHSPLRYSRSTFSILFWPRYFS